MEYHPTVAAVCIIPPTLALLAYGYATCEQFAFYALAVVVHAVQSTFTLQSTLSHCLCDSQAKIETVQRAHLISNVFARAITAVLFARFAHNK